MCFLHSQQHELRKQLQTRCCALLKQSAKKWQDIKHKNSKYGKYQIEQSNLVASFDKGTSVIYVYIYLLVSVIDRNVFEMTKKNEVISVRMLENIG